MSLLAGVLARAALSVGPVEYAALTVLGVGDGRFPHHPVLRQEPDHGRCRAVGGVCRTGPITGQARLTFGASALPSVSRVWPNREEWRTARGAVARGGVIGYLMRKTGFEPGPLILALGAILGRSFRQSMLISNGDLSIFVTRPVAALILLCAAALVCTPLIVTVRRHRAERAARD
jgi:TctA family transporter